MKSSLFILTSFLFLTTVKGGEKKKDVKGLYQFILITQPITVCGDVVLIPCGQNMAYTVYRRVPL